MSFYSSKIIKEQDKRKSPVGAIMLVLLALLAGGAYFVYAKYDLGNKLELYNCYWDSSLATEKFGTEGKLPVSIPEGANILEIGQSLESAGIVSKAEHFACYAKKIDAGQQIQAGYYEVTMPISIEQLIPQLKLAKIPSLRVTIPEGLRLDEIAKVLDQAFTKDNPINTFSLTEFLSLTESQEVIDSKPYLKGKTSLEGFLFPDTYEFSKNATPEEIIDTMLETFESKSKSTGVLEAKNPYNVIVLASIIEKEAGRSYEEKQMISDILQKRLDSGYMLEVDATFLYEKKDWKAVIYATDKLSSSPYNTYKHKGLPPTPICNPGYDSIAAVMNRKENPYWFYLHGTDGVVRYGKTYEEHLQNISLYLR